MVASYSKKALIYTRRREKKNQEIERVKRNLNILNKKGLELCNMEDILKDLGLARHIEKFVREKISPDIVCHLSAYEMNCLGLDRSEMMRLRIKCALCGNYQPMRKATREFEIPKEVLENLLESNFSVKDICDILSVSESTIYRRFRVYNISKNKFDDIRDEDLDERVSEVTQEFPYCGEVIIRQLLREKGTQVQRYRLRESLHRLDAAAIANRRRRRLTRRVYDVCGVNHLWHIDTNHKLIRWNFVIVGGIDGFSRFITYLYCTDNNRSDTVLQCFKEGVGSYGLPMRVRSDKGLENIKVAGFMISKRGQESMITGKSTHNQKIERLWRDVFDGVLNFYYSLFHFLEDEGILDPLNDAHILALHHVYLGKINEKLTIWRKAWGTHRIRTIKTSPLRLFTAGALNNPIPQLITRGDENDDVEGNITDEGHEEQNQRPIFDSRTTANQRLQEILDQQCPRDWTSSSYGIDVYCKAVDIIERQEQI